jgi:hypothetical protein
MSCDALGPIGHTMRASTTPTSDKFLLAPSGPAKTRRRKSMTKNRAARVQEEDAARYRSRGRRATILLVPLAMEDCREVDTATRIAAQLVNRLPIHEWHRNAFCDDRRSGAAGAGALAAVVVAVRHRQSSYGRLRVRRKIRLRHQRLGFLRMLVHEGANLDMGKSVPPPD